MKLTIINGKIAGIAETDEELSELTRMAEIQIHAPRIGEITAPKRKYKTKQMCEICNDHKKYQNIKLHMKFKHEKPRTAEWFKQKQQ